MGTSRGRARDLLSSFSTKHSGKEPLRLDCVGQTTSTCLFSELLQDTLQHFCRIYRELCFWVCITITNAPLPEASCHSSTHRTSLSGVPSPV